MLIKTWAFAVALALAAVPLPLLAAAPGAAAPGGAAAGGTGTGSSPRGRPPERLLRTPVHRQRRWTPPERGLPLRQANTRHPKARPRFQQTSKADRTGGKLTFASPNKQAHH